MSWNIKTPGDYINGPLTVAGTATVTGDLTASSDVLVSGNEKYVYLYSNYTIGQNPRVRFRAVGAGGGSGYGGDLRISTRASNNNWNTDVLTVDSTGNLGIGTTTPAFKLEVATGTTGQQALANFRTADTTAANNAGIQIYATPSSTAASRSVLISWDADGADAAGGNYFFIQKLGNSGQVDLNLQSNAAMTFLTNGTERARFNNTGAFVLAGGTTTANGIGVAFPATQSASSDANCLDDYEEGTWVPLDASGAALVFAVGSCRYTKVGRLVTIQGSVTYPATASGLNAIWNNFPFVAADNIFLTIQYTDTPIATFTYFSGISDAVYLLTPGVNTINSSLSLRTITFFGNYMV
jgi:hypothetical protein